MAESKELGLVFTPQKIGSVIIPNRLVRSATYESRATEDGFVTDELIKFYEELARGGAGLTITGVTNVREDGRQLALMNGNYSDKYLEGLTKIAGSFHDASKDVGTNSKIFLQIGHSGSHITHWGWQGLSVSSCDFEYPLTHKIPKALTIKEISEIVELYGEAANRGKKAGFNGVQLHGAHGYLITQFYSPYLNHRTDEYGGSTEKRARFALDLLRCIRKKVGNDYPVVIKMNGSDRLTGGLEVEEAAQLAKIFAKEGFNCIEISSYIHKAGMGEKVLSLPPESQKNVRERGLEAFNFNLATHIKNTLKKDPKTNVPVILVGGLYRFEKIKEIIETTGIEFCSMSRPLIRQPNLPLIWKNGPPFPEAECIYCNACTQDFLVKGPRCKGVRCLQKEKEDRKKDRKNV